MQDLTPDLSRARCARFKAKPGMGAAAGHRPRLGVRWTGRVQPLQPAPGGPRRQNPIPKAMGREPSQWELVSATVHAAADGGYTDPD